jgi:hypothetical protein
MASPTSSPEPAKRVRCQAVRTEISPDSRCRTRVELEWSGGVIYYGEGEAINTPEGQIRAGAGAAVQAAENATGSQLRLHIRGVKGIRAFDGHVVIVALRGEDDEQRFDLIGSAAAPDDDLVRGAVLAVLNATNRILENYARDPGDPGELDSR